LSNIDKYKVCVANIFLELRIFGSFAKLGLCVAFCGFANVPNAGWLKEILKNAKGWRFQFFLSPVQIAKHGQFESLSAWSIWSVCRVHF